METLIILAAVLVAVAIVTIRNRRFDRSAPLRERIAPQATELYDEVIYKFYPDSLVRDSYPLAGMKERALRKEDEEKFRCFLGKVAQDAGATAYRPTMLSGWPDEIIIDCSQSAKLNRLAWQAIQDCPPQFLNPSLLSSKTIRHQRSEL